MNRESKRERRQRESARKQGELNAESLAAFLEVANDATYRGQPVRDTAFVAALRGILDPLCVAGNASANVAVEPTLPPPDKTLIRESLEHEPDSTWWEAYAVCGALLAGYFVAPRYAAYRRLERCKVKDCRRWFMQPNARRASCSPACARRLRNQLGAARVRKHRSPA